MRFQLRLPLWGKENEAQYMPEGATLPKGDEETPKGSLSKGLFSVNILRPFLAQQDLLCILRSRTEGTSKAARRGRADSYAFRCSMRVFPEGEPLRVLPLAALWASLSERMRRIVGNICPKGCFRPFGGRNILPEGASGT